MTALQVLQKFCLLCWVGGTKNQQRNRNARIRGWRSHWPTRTTERGSYNQSRKLTEQKPAPPPPTGTATDGARHHSTVENVGCREVWRCPNTQPLLPPSEASVHRAGRQRRHPGQVRRKPRAQPRAGGRAGGRDAGGAGGAHGPRRHERAHRACGGGGEGRQPGCPLEGEGRGGGKGGGRCLAPQCSRSSLRTQTKTSYSERSRGLITSQCTMSHEQLRRRTASAAAA